MICMGEAGMKRVLFKVILPLLVIAAWMNMCYWICIRADGFDFFFYWIMIGCPYGIRKMCMFIVPKNFGIAGNIGIRNSGIKLCHWRCDRRRNYYY